MEMDNWRILAVLSMIFAGFTATTAKLGMKGTTPQTAMLFRALVILGFVLVDFIQSKSYRTITEIPQSSLFYLIFSGAVAGGSWICYYHAIKQGDVSIVNTIDKASIVISMVLAFWWLKEPVTSKAILGCALVTAGMLVLLKK
jgi:transporter family protein